MPNHANAELTLAKLAQDVTRSLREHLRPLAIFHVFFTVLAVTVLLPATAWSLAHLLRQINRPIFTNHQLWELVLSPLGVLWAMATLSLTFLILYLQQAGMILVAIRPRGNRYRVAIEALWSVAWRFPGLAALTIIQVSAHVLLALPCLLSLGWLYDALLGHLDSYYVQRVRPPALWYFIAASLPIVTLWLYLAARLFLRWHLSLPALILEGASPHVALTRSHQLTQGHKIRLVAPVATVVLAILLLPLTTSWLFNNSALPFLDLLPEDIDLVIPVMLAYLIIYLILMLAVTFIGIAINSLLMSCLYLRLAHRQPRPAPPPPSKHPWGLAWAAEALVLVFAVFQAWGILTSFELRDDVMVTAHRGSSMAAPENTLAAIEQAIVDGADFIEIDVRLTSDGEVVLFHDSNLQRLAGSSMVVSETTLETLKTVDVGSWFGDPFDNERIPTLEQAFQQTRGRGRLYIELKPDAGTAPQLIDAVIEELENEQARRERCHQQESMTHQCGNPDIFDDVVIASMSPTLVREIRAQAPRLRTTLFAQLVLPGGLSRSSFDILGLRYNRITEDEVQRAARHDYELHAWTVNDTADMSRLIDMGVDNIITDRPGALTELLRTRRRLSDGELMLVKLRNWLRS
ncbi:glycerophosphodiester phosphodiesterase family protein [Aidingimonas lacisalsi]|uniref:glycerophosphodiester phosphodiesterase family protein n=1 Tax=Aidingimonas lacisalsi TaxID=2604086 RepID=UPI0011D24666|nr:glycerophosphodiester phosphodiesterase family protein [Aidingimonas lacisalsi]